MRTTVESSIENFYMGGSLLANECLCYQVMSDLAS